MKLDDYEFKGVSDEVINFKNDVVTLLNYGKYQPQVISSIPGWKGNRGEFIWMVSATSASLFVYLNTSGTTWSKVVTFNL